MELEPILSAPSTPPLPSARPPAHRHVYRCHRCQSVRCNAGVGRRSHHRRPTWAADFCQRGLDAYPICGQRPFCQTRPRVSRELLTSPNDSPRHCAPRTRGFNLRGCRDALGRRLVRVPAMFVRSPSSARSKAERDSGGCGGLDTPHSDTNSTVRECDPKNLWTKTVRPMTAFAHEVQMRCSAVYADSNTTQYKLSAMSFRTWIVNSKYYRAF